MVLLMPETDEKRSPLARLVIFMVCLSIAGSVVAGVHYVAVDLPAQKAVQVPQNIEITPGYLIGNDANNNQVVVFENDP